jgi:hypothetical protein
LISRCWPPTRSTLGLTDEDEEDILVRLIDEFLALKGA